MEIIYDEFCLIDMEIINYLFILLSSLILDYSKLIIIIILKKKHFKINLVCLIIYYHY
jgi:hypothetical protein